MVREPGRCTFSARFWSCLLGFCCFTTRAFSRKRNTEEGYDGGARDLYCGRNDCYELLELQRGASLGDIKKSYRKLALKWHPDKNKEAGAVETFRAITRAYEILSDEDMREAYHYFQDNPDAYMSHYYQYYRAAYQPKTPLWIVVVGVLVFLSILQHINNHWKYNAAIRAVMYQQQFKRRVNERLDAEVKKLKLSKVEKEVLRGRIEMDVLENECKLGGELFAKPSLRRLIGVRALMLPWTITYNVYWQLAWVYRFSIKGESYGPEEREYLTKCALRCGETWWSAQGEDQRQELIARKLWEPEPWAAFVEEQKAVEEERLRKLQNSGAYKRAKRYMRNRAADPHGDYED
eukprot:TRINITY_DN18618_c0_g2_i1.p1 TRINITY_DN18618_c0_g2~~TRINITY_DN18618_c0_g2_i1.p1  ORF type:complete len:349 (+),score=38.51 TRINITY_DN18618_c0_g2_i1:79-1125(+)